ncbi:hypothetical protein ACUOA8_58305, partial [Escherichia sp. SS-MK2]
MMVQHLKRRPLSRYLKDFKHSQTHCRPPVADRQVPRSRAVEPA